ncbi:MAG: rubredoxin-like domain-containing protein [Desulfosalsimonas sp.]
MANIENGTVFKKDKEVTWKCQNCGYTSKGTEAPQECPSCAHPRDHFEVLCENWQ